ncbi:MAG: hypothetical protein Q8N15_00710 [Bacillota bacterium]|nr:hypothetical protein [Bacillota bacterium]
MTFSILLPIFLAPVWPPDLRAVLYFLMGTVFGFTMCSLTIAAIFLGREKKHERERIASGALQQEADIRAIIKKKQEMLPEIAGASGNSWFRAAFELSIELMHEIAAHYFPDKRYPIYELTPQELIDLDRYVVTEIEKIINGKVIRRFKKYRISTIVEIVNKKRDLDNVKIIKINKQYQISKFLGTVSAIVNYANPITWIKKSAVKPLSDYVTKEAAKRIIAIVGEQVDKLYSHKMFAPADDAEKVEVDIEAAATEAEAVVEPEKEVKPK